MKLSIMSILIIIGMGIYSFISIPKKEMPNINIPFGMMVVEAPGVSATDMEENVIRDIEEILSSYSDVKDFQVVIQEGSAMFQVQLDASISNPGAVFDDIKSGLYEWDTPSVVKNINYIFDFTSPHGALGINKEGSEKELYGYADTLKTELLKIKEVSKVDIHSGYDEKVNLWLKEDLSYNDLPFSLVELENKLIEEGTNAPTGSLNGAAISIPGNIHSIDELLSLKLTSLTGEDNHTVGTFFEASKINNPLAGIYQLNGKTSAYVSYSLVDGIDFTKLTSEIQAAIDRTEAHLGKGSVVELSSQPISVGEDIKGIIQDLLFAMGIVSLIVLIGLGVRNAVGVAITMPLIVLASLSVLFFVSEGLEIFSIAGIIVSMGILVDNSIVISDAIQYRLDNGMEKKTAAVDAVRSNWVPVLAATLTTIAAFIPMMFMPGGEGKMILPLPLTVAITITISFFVAMVFMPVISTFLFKPATKRKDSKISKKTTAIVDSGVRKAIKRPWVTLGITVGSFILVIIFIVPMIGVKMLPQLDKSIISISFEDENYSREGAIEKHNEIIEVINEFDVVVNYASSIGESLPAFESVLPTENISPSKGMFVLWLDDSHTKMSYWVDKINDRLEEKGIEAAVKAPEMSMPIPTVSASILGNDGEVLEETIRAINEDVSKLSYAMDISNSIMPEIPAFDFTPNRDELAANGISLTSFNSQVSTFLTGLGISDVFSIDGQSIDINISANNSNPETALLDLWSLNIKSDNPDLAAVPFSTLVHENSPQEAITMKPVAIVRTNGLRSLGISSYATSGNDLKLSNEFKKIVEKHTNGKDLDVIYGGALAYEGELMGDLLFTGVIAIVVIFLILFLQFNSLLKPVLILLTVPLSFIGVFFIFWLTGTDLSMMAILGVIALMGIVVNAGILLVDHVMRDIKAGYTTHDAIVNAVNRRTRPILISSITTMTGLIPLAISQDPFFTPMALIVIGGLFTATFLTILVFPALLYIVMRKKDEKKTSIPIIKRKQAKKLRFSTK